MPPFSNRARRLFHHRPAAHAGAEVHYTSPDARQEIVGKASLARGDLMEQWREKEKSISVGPRYARIRLEETEFRGEPAVVREYSVTAQELPWHVRSLGFNTGGKSYRLTTWYHPDIRTGPCRSTRRSRRASRPCDPGEPPERRTGPGGVRPPPDPGPPGRADPPRVQRTLSDTSAAVPFRPPPTFSFTNAIPTTTAATSRERSRISRLPCSVSVSM